MYVKKYLIGKHYGNKYPSERVIFECGFLSIERIVLKRMVVIGVYGNFNKNRAFFFIQNLQWNFLLERANHRQINRLHFSYILGFILLV